MSDLPQFLYRLEPARPGFVDAPTPEEQESAARHFAYLADLVEKKVIFLCGRTLGDETFGIVVFRAASEEAAREIMERDPGVSEGIMRATLYPYRVALSAAPWPDAD